MSLLSKSICASILAGASSAPAWSAPTIWADIDLTSYRMSVVDIDPNDRIDASFSSAWTGRTVAACFSQWDFGCRVSTADPLRSLSLDRQVPGSRETPSAGPEMIHSQVEGTRYTGYPGAEAYDNRMLTFSGAGRFTVEVDYHLEGSGFDATVGSAYAGIMLGGWSNPFKVEQLELTEWIPAWSRDGTLSLTIDMVDGQQSRLSAYAWAGTYGGPPVISPVPEPAAWAMLLAGASLVGVGVRRRRR